MCPGVRHRRAVATAAPAAAAVVPPRVPGPQLPPTRRVQQVPPQFPPQQRRVAPQRSYLDAARVPPVGQHNSQQRAQQAQHSQQQVNQPPPRQQGQAPPQQLQQQQPQQQQPHHQQQVPAMRGPVAAELQKAAHGQYVPVLPVGPLPQAALPNPQPANVGAQPILAANIFSADEDAAAEQEDAWVEEETVQELDEEVRDPIRVYTRIGRVNKAIQRREKRLDKAKKEVDLQKAVVEEALAELAARAHAVDSIDADLQRLREVQQELSTRHANLVAEAAQQQRAPLQTCAEDEAQRAQQLLWNTAASLRQLGDDPRLSQAIALLGTLFQEASAVAAAEQEQPNQYTVAQRSLPVQVAVSAPTPTIPPSAVPPPQSAICQRCWSVACRCGHLVAAPATPTVVDIEVDQERGQKRSCVEAALPGRGADGQRNPGALLVDSSGAPAHAEENEEKRSITVDSLPASSRGDDAEDGCQAMESSSPQNGLPPNTGADIAVDSIGEPSGLPSPVQESADPGEVAAKEQSRSAFSALVKEACTLRSYPY